MVGAGKETRPPVTKQNVALITMRPEVVCTKRQRKRMKLVARQQGARMEMPPYLDTLTVVSSGRGEGYGWIKTYMSAR